MTKDLWPSKRQGKRRGSITLIERSIGLAVDVALGSLGSLLRSAGMNASLR